LYKNGINPLYSTTNISQAGVTTSGVVIWGQKTTLRGESPLTRLAVRRLLIQIRKSARTLAQQYLFEPNSDGVAAALESSLSSLLSGILNNNGIENFRIALDTPSNSSVNVENNRLSGRIYIQPKKTLEYVTLDFDTSSI
jgi:phage tail sheath protein FI